MPRLPGLHKRLSKAEELELELARQGSVARLERLLAQRAGIDVDDDEASAEDDEGSPEDTESPGDGAIPTERAMVAVMGAELETGDGTEPHDAIAAGDDEAPIELAAGVSLMGPDAIDATRRQAVRRQAAVQVVEDDWDIGGPEAQSTTEAATDPSPEESAKPASRPRKPRGTKAAAPAGSKAPAPAATAKSPVVPPPPPRPRAASRLAVHPKRPKRQPRQPLVLAACPSCAVLLDPRPTASRRCRECRERIVVKRLEGGVLYLTAPAAAALEAAQRKAKETARLSRIRGRWLAQAASVGAPSASIERIVRVAATEDSVQAARALYLAAANRAFLAARREHRMADAATIRRTHALALLREQADPTVVPDDVLGLYRDAMIAELKAQREFGRDAELIAASCCDTCRDDNGLIARISDEVKVGRLPHTGCPKGICACRWAPPRAGGRRPASKAATAK